MTVREAGAAQFALLTPNMPHRGSRSICGTGTDLQLLRPLPNVGARLAGTEVCCGAAAVPASRRNGHSSCGYDGLV